MPDNWLAALDKSELEALIPSKAARHVDDIELAAFNVAEDMMQKGLIAKKSPPPPRRAAKKGTKKKAGPRKHRITEKKTAQKPRPKPVYKKLWESIKREFHLLICTDDRKYKSVRESLDKHGAQAGTITVGIISAGVAGILGCGVGMCVPFISLLLIALLAVGKNAYCSTVV